MGLLDSTDREILKLRLQGCEHGEIANATGCSERTVRRRFRSIRQLCVERHEQTGDISPLDSDLPMFESEAA